MTRGPAVIDTGQGGGIKGSQFRTKRGVGESGYSLTPHAMVGKQMWEVAMVVAGLT